MRNKNTSGGSRRQKWLNMYRAFTTFMLVTLVVMLGFGLSKLSDVSDRSFAPITVEQSSKVQTAASYLETAGFTNPIYLGIVPWIEGEYPTFTVNAIGGERVDVAIRTTKNGAMEIQPKVIFQTVASADEFARLAAEAVVLWEDIPANIQARTDGAWGEYESRKYNYEQLSKYTADSYGLADEAESVAGWPRQ